MKTNKTLAEKASDSLIFISFFCVLILLAFPETVKKGASEGLYLAMGTVVPSVFPMLILSAAASECRIPEFIKKAVHKPLLYLFGMGADSFAAILTGVTGGYIISAKNALHMFRERKINAEEAKRLVLFFTCPGLSFCINIAGLCVMGSAFNGFSLFLSNVAASFTAAFLYNRIKKNNFASNYADNKNKAVPEILVLSVKSAAESVISISAWITAYSTFGLLSETIIKNNIIKNIIRLSGEVTSAVIFSAENYSIYMTVFILSAAGICIFLQLLPCLSELKIKPSAYIFSRLSVSCISVVFEKVFTIIFPEYIQVFSGKYSVRLYSHNIAGGAALVLLSIVFINFMNKELNKNRFHNI